MWDTLKVRADARVPSQGIGRAGGAAGPRPLRGPGGSWGSWSWDVGDPRAGGSRPRSLGFGVNERGSARVGAGGVSRPAASKRRVLRRSRTRARPSPPLNGRVAVQAPPSD